MRSSAAFQKLKHPAVIPGLLSGFVIWFALFLSHTGMIPVGTQAFRAIIIELFFGPLILAIAGMFSEIIRNRDGRYEWTPWIPFSAGFLGAGIAMVMMFAETAMFQYLPLMEPGLTPRLTYVIGHVLMYIPIIIVVIAFYSLFSLVAGICVHAVQEREGSKKPTGRTG